MKLFAQNKKARHDFHIEETYETGIELTGPEVKSIRAGRANLKESYARIRGGEAFLVGAHVSPYENATHVNQDPVRQRKLLLNKREIARLVGKSQESGKTIVPLDLHPKNGVIKLQIGVASRKQEHDKWREIAKKTMQRETEKAIKERSRV
jgi:SsrA-binding protein